MPTAEDLDRALSHSWDWFALHAAQRLQMVNFWLLSVAFLVAAYVGAMVDDQPEIGVGVATAGVAVTFGFHRLERRTRQLIRLAEVPIASLQANLAAVTGVPSLELCAAADREKRSFSSYGDVIRAMQWCIGVCFAVAVAFSLGVLLAD